MSPYERRIEYLQLFEAYMIALCKLRATLLTKTERIKPSRRPMISSGNNKASKNPTNFKHVDCEFE